MTDTEWRVRVKAQAGTVTRWPPNVEPGSNTGKLAARYGARHYVLAPLDVRLRDSLRTGNDTGDIAAGRIFNPLENLADSAARKGVLGLLAAALGVPMPVLLVILLVVVYLVLKNAGLVGSR